MVKLNKEFINKLPSRTDKEKVYWDDELKGFGLRCQGKSKTWIIMYRNQFNKQKKLTIGKLNLFTPNEARNLAKQKLADIVANGSDPSLLKNIYKNDITVSELCDLYMQEGVLNKKETTIKNDKSRIERHVKPLIGNLPLKALQKKHIDKMVLDITNHKTALKTKSNKPRGVINVKGGIHIAKRTLEMLSAILSFAKLRGFIDENPALGIPKPKTNKREEYLEAYEIKQLGKMLKHAEKYKITKTLYLDAIRLLALTGCRENEILSLKWDYVDFDKQCFRFPTTKTGPQIRPFGLGAKHILERIKQNSSSEWVFPSSRGTGHFVSILKVLKKIMKLKGDNQQPFINKDICIHTLRHSFASIAADKGYIELIISGLLGHKPKGVTNRYSHTPDASLILAANDISLHIEKLLDD